MSRAMRNRKPVMAALAVASLLVSGCAAAAGSTGGATPTAPTASESPTTTPSGDQHSEGQHAEGQQSGDHSANSAAVTSPATASAGGASEASKMICGQETKDDISSILALKEAPHAVDDWSDSTYACTYHLADGPLVISVKESPDSASARKYFDALASRIGTTAPIKGLSNLGFPAYQTKDGSVVFLKDNSTLYVNATRLPAAVGPQKVTPTAFAYQVSTTILACWTEHH